MIAIKIKFIKLPTTDGIIKVSLDGGQSFTEYNIADVRESGIPLEDNQDYEKIQIQARASILKNLNVVSGVKVEGAEAGITNEPSFIMDTDTYGFEFPNCVTGITLPNGITKIQDSSSLPRLFRNLQTIIIPEGVTSIGNDAFLNCTGFTSIAIPESVTSIGSRAFSSCMGLTSITIPESVTSIGKNAFNSCTSLKTINYTGTQVQWNAISKGTDWNQGCPSDMVINYNYQG